LKVALIPKPAEPISDELIELRPLEATDAAAIVATGDADGFRQLMGPGERKLEHLAPDQALKAWALGFSVWHDSELPITMIRTCFAVRSRADPNHLAGIVGFNCPVGAQWAGRLNVFYWIAPNMRCKGYASRAVALGTAWALEAWGLKRAFAHATSPASVRVAEKAEFRATGETLDGSPILEYSKG
jgi:RimJ/RimL family protein N-acetyltransferase